MGTNVIPILQVRNLALRYPLCFGQDWLFQNQVILLLLNPGTRHSGLARVKSVELNTWEGMQSSCQQELNEVDEVYSECLSGSRFSSLTVAASFPFTCVGISWFLTRQFLGTKATLEINKIHILELKDYCFLFTIRKQGGGK